MVYAYGSAQLHATTQMALFSVWNAEIRRSREEYDSYCREIEQPGYRPLAEYCRSGRHKLDETAVYRESAEKWRCKACRNIRDAARRRRKGITKGKNLKRFDEQQCRQLAERYAAGEASTTLAKEFNTYSVTVLRAIVRGGGEVRSQSASMHNYFNRRNNQPGDELSA